MRRMTSSDHRTVELGVLFAYTHTRTSYYNEHIFTRREICVKMCIERAYYEEREKACNESLDARV